MAWKGWPSPTWQRFTISSSTPRHGLCRQAESKRRIEDPRKHAGSDTGVPGGTTDRKFSERVRVPPASRPVGGAPAVVLSRVRKADRLVRQHSGGELFPAA